MVVITAAVEGDLDEAVLRSTCEAVGIILGVVHGRNGKPALLQNIRGYNNAANYSPWVVLLDLDRDCECAATCRQQWLAEPSPFMCFRIAVRAIEAWILSDRERIAQFLGVSEAIVPRNPDQLDNPKIALVDLARRSRRRRIREELTPAAGSGRQIGPLYTSSLIHFVQNADSGWRAIEAARISDSLARCLTALRRLSDNEPI